MLKLSYSLNGLTNVNLYKGITEIENAGFSGFEFSFQKGIFDPDYLSDEDIEKIQFFLSKRTINPVCISTATTFFLSSIPHEPSVLSLESNRRSERIKLIKKGIDLARILKVPIVSFQSGYLRKEHVSIDARAIRNMLLSAVKELVAYIGEDNITLVIEPEPGMYIETIADALSIIKEINSSHFKLHMDIGHVFCSEENYLKAIQDNINEVAYMHLADIKTGDAVRFRALTSPNDSEFNRGKGERYLYSASGSFLYIDDVESILFRGKNKIDFPAQIIDKTVNMSELPMLTETENLYVEAKAYIDSIGGIEFSTLKNLLPIIKYLRGGESPIIGRTICNTIKGKVHYHERLGYGEIDIKTVLGIVQDSNYEGYMTVELYNHVDMWEQVLPESYKYIQDYSKKFTEIEKCINLEWGLDVMGDALDHRKVTPPYVRMVSYRATNYQDYIFTFDLRFVQPGREKIPLPILHSLEHLLMKEFRILLGNKYIALAPMGCQTGFYLVTLNFSDKKEFSRIYKEALETILSEYVVPYQNKIQCGNPSEHNLEGAKQYVQYVLKSFNDIYTVL